MSSNLAIDSDSIEEICDTLLTQEELNKPYVFEDVFIRDIIPLLVRPWDPDNLVKYNNYVKELTNELRILSREEKPQLLDTVPALYPRPTSTMPDSPTAATAGNLAQHLQQERLRNPFPQDHIMTDFLLRISATAPVEETVLKPLARILAKYGRAFEDDNGVPLYSLTTDNLSDKVNPTQELPELEQSSYSDEYDD